MPPEVAHPTILFYIYGDQSIKLAEDLRSLSSAESQKQFLIKFYKPYFSRLPNYVEGAQQCTPIDCLATSWVADEFAGNGSYTYACPVHALVLLLMLQIRTMRTGLKEADKDIETMRAGLPGRSLWFAGEHTAAFIALGTTSGAYMSGEAVAKRIATAYNMDIGLGKAVDGDGPNVKENATTESGLKTNF